MSKHTPGPWEGRLCPNMPAEPLDYGVIHGGKEVARIWRREDVDLIAAAPELLEALSDLLAADDWLYAAAQDMDDSLKEIGELQRKQYGAWNWANWSGAREKARAAIAKAEGRS